MMRYTLKMVNAGIAVTQYTINGWELTYNPDDDKYYVIRDGKTAVFGRWANAVYYAKTH
jgi:hypothetical protein